MANDNIAPNLAYHCWYFGIIGENLTTRASAKCMTKGTEFDPDMNIEYEDDEGHTGIATTKMSSYRKTAEANPSYTDKCRFVGGFEDVFYMLLGDYTKIPVAGATEAQKYVFEENALNPKTPPFVTLYNGFYKTATDAFIYDNALLNEFTLTINNEEAPTYKVGFNSDFPEFQQPNPARVVPAKDIFVKPADVGVYIAEPGVLTEANMEDYRYGCFLDGELTVNNNNENQACSDNDFGTSTKNMGERESNFKLTLPWTEKTKKIQYKFLGGSDTATKVTTDNDVKEVWIKMSTGEIETVGADKIPYSVLIKIPEINLQVASSPQSGTDAKQLELEGKVMENAVSSFLSVEIISSLSELHIDNS